MFFTTILNIWIPLEPAHIATTTATEGLWPLAAT
jgi:hypothetical protein